MISERQFVLKKKDGIPRQDCFCRTPELIENYDKAIADTTRTWDCHHRLETHNSDGEKRLVDISRAELIALNMYYDRPPEELIFLTSAEHVRLHCKGKKIGPQSKEHRRKISEAHKGKHHSEESKRKMSEARKGKKLSEETKKKLSEIRKGKPRNRQVKHWKLVDGKRVWY